MLGALLLLGFLTPLASGSAAVAAVVLASPQLRSAGWPGAYAVLDQLSFAALAFALLLLGPGAFSLDARLFGRREIIIPPARDTLRKR